MGATSLQDIHETGNKHNRHAMDAYRDEEPDTIVGHLPREIAFWHLSPGSFTSTFVCDYIHHQLRMCRMLRSCTLKFPSPNWRLCMHRAAEKLEMLNFSYFVMICTCVCRYNHLKDAISHVEGELERLHDPLQLNLPTPSLDHVAEQEKQWWTIIYCTVDGEWWKLLKLKGSIAK